MEQKKTFAHYLFLLLLCYYPIDAGSSVVDCYINKALSQVGVQEATGKNDGKEIFEYQKTTNTKQPAPYCASFVNWALINCGVKTTNTASVWALFNQNKLIEIVYDRRTKATANWERVKKGDIFSMFFPNLNREAHTGFVYEIHSTYIITIEANTSPNAVVGSQNDRNGNGVWKKKRSKKGIYRVLKFKQIR